MSEHIPGKQYYYLKNDQAHGPIEETKLRTWIRKGEILKDFRICPAGSETWLPVSNLPFWETEHMNYNRQKAMQGDPATSQSSCGVEILCGVLGVIMFLLFLLTLFHALDDTSDFITPFFCLTSTAFLLSTQKALYYLRGMHAKAQQ